jgi:DNA/RNA-binding domain of Phe-tRNA-synthetase-like protein
MFIRLDPTLLARYPAMRVSVLIAQNIDTAALEQAAAAAWPQVDEERVTRVVADWKRLHKTLSSDRNARSSIAYLVKAAGKGSLRRIHPLVDLYNHASLRSLSPFGGEDIACLAGGLVLTCAQGNEVFRPLGRGEQTEQPGADETVWLDGQGRVVCRALNWLESDLHKITAHSRDVVFVSERPSADFPDPEPGMDWLAAQLAPHCTRQFRALVDAAAPCFDAGD